ncbi:MAG: histidine kinase, partial [Pseudomonadota bacterium]
MADRALSFRSLRWPISVSFRQHFRQLALALSLALVIEQWLPRASAVLPIAWLSLGVLVGTLLTAKRTSWLWLVLSAVVLFAIGQHGLYGEPFDSISALRLALFGGSALLIASTPTFLLQRRQREFLTHELLPAFTVGGLISAMVTAWVLKWVFPAHVEGQWLTTFLSVILGVSLSAPIIAVRRNRYSEWLHRSLPRKFIENVLVGTLLAGTILALCTARATEMTLTMFFSLPFWVAGFAGIVLTQVTSMRGTLVWLLASIVCGLLLMHWQTPLAGSAVIAYAQQHVFTVVAVVLTCATLTTNVRRVHRQDHHWRLLMRSMAGMQAAQSSDRFEETTADFGHALELILGATHADEVRLYEVNQQMDGVNCVYTWYQPAANVEPGDSNIQVPLQRLESLLIGLIQRGVVHVPPEVNGDALSASEADDVRQALQLTGYRELQIFPVMAGDECAAFVVLASRHSDKLWTRNAPTLVQVIGDYYLSFRHRQRNLERIKRYQRQLSELAASLAESEEAIRRSTAVALHDGPIQQLAVMRMKLGEMSQRRVTAPDAIDTITEIIDESLIKVRDMLRNLSPSILYELGLVPALQDYIDGTQELTDIEILFEQQGNRVHLEEPLRVAMFQAICELITNSVKHAGCNHIWVTLDWSEADLARVTV